MFTVEILTAVGKPPLTVSASQVVVRLPNGTPVSLAALFGDGVMVSHCDDATFNDNLKKIGINETVINSKVKV